MAPAAGASSTMPPFLGCLHSWWYSSPGRAPMSHLGRTLQPREGGTPASGQFAIALRYWEAYHQQSWELGACGVVCLMHELLVGSAGAMQHPQACLCHLLDVPAFGDALQALEEGFAFRPVCGGFLTAWAHCCGAPPLSARGA